MWKPLPNDNILAWKKLALSQQGRSVLGTGAKISGANLFTRLNYWIVACGGQPVLVPSWAWRIPPALPACPGTVIFRLNRKKYDVI